MARHAELILAATAQLTLGASVRRAVIVILAIAILAGVAHIALPLALQPRLAPPNRAPSAGAPLTFDDALARAAQQVADAGQVAGAHPDEWLHQERLALAWVAKARLTGAFDDYAAAQAALDQGFAHARPGAGPHLTQAGLDLSLHRLAAAAPMLDALDHYAVPPEQADADEIAGMRGDIAFYRGRYAEAWKVYARGGASGPASFRRAVFQARTGKTDAALASLDDMERALRFPSAQTLANLELQRGAYELQRGDWPRAAAHFDRAERLFPGDWLTEAHRAQMRALAGHRAEAIVRLTAVARRSGAPEVMDALAALYRAEGDGANSHLWSDRAGAIWERRLQQIPEAAWGHAVEHYLAFGDPARALDLARRDYAARPYGASAVALAWAEIAADRPAQALRILEPVMAGRYVSADVYVAAAQAQRLLGRDPEAEAARKHALALNPHSLDRDGALIWFGH